MRLKKTTPRSLPSPLRSGKVTLAIEATRDRDLSNFDWVDGIAINATICNNQYFTNHEWQVGPCPVVLVVVGVRLWALGFTSRWETLCVLVVC
jgi:hypothetical protein